MKEIKVKALVDCVGLDYDLKKDEIKELKKPLAEKLINFGYVEEVKSGKSKEKSDE